MWLTLLWTLLSVGLGLVLVRWALLRACARIFGCRSVAIGRLGFLSVASIKVRFRRGHSLELSHIRLSSSFLNHDNSKPLLVSVADVRLEAELRPRDPAADPHEPQTPETPAEGGPEALAKLSRQLRHYLYWLQYVGVRAERVGLVVLYGRPQGPVFPEGREEKGWLLHLGAEAVELETWRDRDGVQTELSSSLLTAKLLSRQPKAQEPLAQLSLAFRLAADFPMAPDAALWKSFGLVLSNPVLTLADGTLPALREGLAARPAPLPVQSDEPSQPQSRLFAHPLFPANLKVETENLRLALAPYTTGRSGSCVLGGFCVQLRREEGAEIPCAELAVKDVSAEDDLGSSASLQSFVSDTLVLDSAPQSRVHISQGHATLTVESLKRWLPLLSSPQQVPRQRRPRPKRALPSLTAELSDLSVRLRGPADEDVLVETDFVSLNSRRSESIELGVESLWVRRVRSGEARPEPLVSDPSRVHWGAPLSVSALLLRRERCGKTNDWRWCLEGDGLRLEWDPEWALRWTATLVPLLPARPPSSAAVPRPPEKPRPKAPLKVVLTDVSVHATLRGSVVLALSSEKIAFDRDGSTYTTVFHQLLMFYLPTPDFSRPQRLSKLMGGCQFKSGIPVLKVVYAGEEHELMLGLAEGGGLVWSPPLHMCWLELVRKWKELRALTRRGEEAAEVAPSEEKPRSRRLYQSLVSEGECWVAWEVGSGRRMEMRAPELRLERSASGEMAGAARLFWLLFDGRRIGAASELLLWKRRRVRALAEARAAFPSFTTASNWAWELRADRLTLAFPFRYDFAGCWEQLSAAWKWLKLVHGRRPAPFTADSPLPADFRLSLKLFRFQMDDDPFESRLRANLELLQDEFDESQRRQAMLDSKLADLRRDHPLLPRAKSEELHRSLMEKNAGIYIQRWRQLSLERERERAEREAGEEERTGGPGHHSPSQGPTQEGPPLFCWRVTGLEVKVVADGSLHGRPNVLRLMRELDPDSPVGPESLEFVTHWARGVELDAEEWSVQLRDYPQPYQSLRDAHFWGRLAGAEARGGDRSQRASTLDLGQPWGSFTVQRNMPPLKFYYDLCAELGEMNMAYGPCWEPCLAMVNLCFNQISRPSLDPSLPLPFWDKMRLLLHGRMSIICAHLTTAMLASPDPYNTTEHLEISWEGFQFHWDSGRVRVEADVDAFVRTASKYDDIRLFHLPALRLSIGMDWRCSGDRHDHHSVTPCAPDKLPAHFPADGHDSYRAFRSSHLALSLQLNVRSPGPDEPESRSPQMLLYANTFRWLDSLKNTLSAVNRPVKRGPLFGNPRRRRPQLSRHTRTIQLQVSLPKFIVSYWMSFSSNHGFKLTCASLSLSSSHALALAPQVDKERPDLKRRPHARWSIRQLTTELLETRIELFAAGSQSEGSLLSEAAKNFFVGISRLSYTREPKPQPTAGQPEPSVQEKGPLHRLVASDLRGLWTDDNRDSILAILDGIQKSRQLRRNLSTDALALIQFAELSSSTTGKKAEEEKDRTMEENSSASLLQKLISEANTKLVAYSEQTTEGGRDTLTGVGMCETEDVLASLWEIQLLNSQVAFRGCETGGFVLCTAAKADVTQRLHVPVWKGSELLGKRSWVGFFSGIQYYAPFSPTTVEDEVRWVPSSLVEERSGRAEGSGLVDDGEAAGGVVSDYVTLEHGRQLQRVISRCSCQVYFLHFSDTFDLEDIPCIPRPPSDTDDSSLRRPEYVDCFTLKHNMLNVSTNPTQYQVLVDIINNLILYVDPAKKQAAEKRLRLRFKLQVTSSEDLRPAIWEAQAGVRSGAAELRAAERDAYHLSRQLHAAAPNSALAEHCLASLRALEQRMEEEKAQLAARSEELALMISCFKEKQVRALRQFSRSSQEAAAPIARRFEVFFEEALWRLTEKDGQLGLSDLRIRHFLYTKISRINDSGEHLLEIADIAIANLIPNSRYRDVLRVAGEARGAGVLPDRRPPQPAIRVICREMAPVGGIRMKEHFEINIVPMVAQMTYVFFRAMMNYFFPGRNIDADDKDIERSTGGVEGSLVSKGSFSRASTPVGKGPAPTGSASSASLSGGKKRRKRAEEPPFDEIEKMKERAEENTVFLYIKIPEVPFTVSYKGEKEKNIEDVESFQLVFPLVEFHDRTWTWLDLALAIKHRSKRVLLQQFMKQKLLRNRLLQPSQPKPSALPDQAKARIVLGALATASHDSHSKPPKS